MQQTDAPRPSGRRAQARRNDELVVEAARAVFTQDPAARMSAVAERAGVGQGSLYRRYPSKEALLAHVCANGMQRMRAAAREALESGDDAWTALSGFLHWYLDSQTPQLIALVGTFTPEEELFELARETNELLQALVDRAVAEGRLRADVSGGDLTLLVEMLSRMRRGEPTRDAVLRKRYLTLLLQALALNGAPELPGPAPDAKELERPWRQA